MMPHMFAEHLLLYALATQADSVPNTRIVLARLLTEHVLKSGEYWLFVLM